MSFSINSNLSAMQVYDALAKVNSVTQKAQLRLASHKKINCVADDTSGYRVGKSLESKTVEQKSQLNNASSAKNYIATAESSLNNINELLNQISVKYADAQDPTKNKTTIASDIRSIATEIDSIMKNTTMNGRQLLANVDGTALASSDQFDIGGASRFTADFANNSYLKADDLMNKLHGGEAVLTEDTPVDTIYGAAVSYTGMDGVVFLNIPPDTSSTTKITYEDGTSDISTVNLPQGSIPVSTLSLAFRTSIHHNTDSMIMVTFNSPVVNMDLFNYDKKITSVNTISGYDLVGLFGLNYGSYSPGSGEGLLSSDVDAVITAAGDLSAIKTNVQNSLGRIGNLSQTIDFRSDFLTSAIANNTSSISRLFDADMANEQLNATKGSIAGQVATNMLSQANQAPQAILSLFR